MSNTSRQKPLVLCILDGWGVREENSDNAIALAKTPVWDSLLQTSPHTTLATHGEWVGLPEGQMGNSEVGHMTIGSGRIVFQELPRISRAIADDSLRQNPILQNCLQQLRKSGKSLHLMGLFSGGGVHAHQDHILALAKYAAEAQIKVFIHAFLDGRDTPPKSAEAIFRMLEKNWSLPENVKFATVSGRYYAMDRDNRFERINKAYDAIASADGQKAASPLAAITNSYAHEISDEFILPTIIGNYSGIENGDALLMANFRSDRARQLLSAFCDPEFKGFQRKFLPKISEFIGMVEYSEQLNNFLKTLFPAKTLTDSLGEVIAKSGLKQLRLAETEKYAHVTFFFNGGREEVFAGEERILIPSPKIATYDQKPEMSAPEVTEKLVAAINSQKFDLIVVNFANTDMVGHTGDLSAAIKAVEAVDKALGEINSAILATGGILCISADHGNAECMRDAHTGEPHTAHTVGDVPFVVSGCKRKLQLAQHGGLSDIAPTILALLDIAQPAAMTGKSLLQGT